MAGSGYRPVELWCKPYLKKNSFQSLWNSLEKCFHREWDNKQDRPVWITVVGTWNLSSKGISAFMRPISIIFIPLGFQNDVLGESS